MSKVLVLNYSKYGHIETMARDGSCQPTANELTIAPLPE